MLLKGSMEVCQAGGWEEMPLQNRQCGPGRGASVDEDSLVEYPNTEDEVPLYTWSPLCWQQHSPSLSKVVQIGRHITDVSLIMRWVTS